MFIETRYFDDGRAQAKLYQNEPKIEESPSFDSYVEEYDTIEEFLEEIEVELDDVVPLVLSLTDGKLVDITRYI